MRSSLAQEAVAPLPPPSSRTALCKAMHYPHAGAGGPLPLSGGSLTPTEKSLIKLRSGAPGEAETATPPPNSSPFRPIPRKQGGSPSHASLEPYVPAELVLTAIQPLLRFGPLLQGIQLDVLHLTLCGPPFSRCRESADASTTHI